MAEDILTKETTLGTCPVCAEPVTWRLGSRLVAYVVRNKYEDGHETEYYYHLRCRKKEIFDRTTA